MLKVFIYLSLDQAAADKETIYPNQHALISLGRCLPPAGKLWLKPEQKLVLAHLHVPICKMQKLGH